MGFELCLGVVGKIEPAVSVSGAEVADVFRRDGINRYPGGYRFVGLVRNGLKEEP